MPFSTNNKIQIVDESGDPVALGSGIVTTETLRVTIAADDPLFLTLSTNISDCEALLTTIDADTANLGYLSYIARVTGNAFSVGNYGTTALAVRNDTLESTAGITDGEYSPLQTDSIGGLYVTGSEIENAAVQSEPLLIGGRYDSSARTLGDGDAGAVALNASGHVLTALAADDPHFGAVGAAADADGVLHGQLRYMNDRLVAIESDTGPMNTNISYLVAAIDTTGTSFSSSDVGNPALVVRNDTLANLDGNIADGDYSMLQVNATGALYVDGSGFTQPISGTVTANLSATDNAVLDAMVVDLAAIEALLTTIDVDTGSTAGYLSNLSGTQYQDDANWTDGSSKHLLVGGLYQSSMQSVTDGDVAPFQIDANGVLRTSHSITGLASDDNPTVGTSAEQLITDGADGATACKRVDIMAHPDNTGYIWVGDSAVSVDGLNGGIRLSPGDFYSMDIDNTGDIYVIATVDTENVCYNYFT